MLSATLPDVVPTSMLPEKLLQTSSRSPETVRATRPPVRPPTVISPLVEARSTDFADRAGASRLPETVWQENESARDAPRTMSPETVVTSRTVNVLPAGTATSDDTPWMTSAPR